MLVRRETAEIPSWPRQCVAGMRFERAGRTPSGKTSDSRRLPDGATETE